MWGSVRGNILWNQPTFGVSKNMWKDRWTTLLGRVCLTLFDACGLCFSDLWSPSFSGTSWPPNPGWPFFFRGRDSSVWGSTIHLSQPHGKSLWHRQAMACTATLMEDKDRTGPHWAYRATDGFVRVHPCGTPQSLQSHCSLDAWTPILTVNTVVASQKSQQLKCWSFLPIYSMHIHAYTVSKSSLFWWYAHCPQYTQTYTRSGYWIPQPPMIPNNWHGWVDGRAGRNLRRTRRRNRWPRTKLSFSLDGFDGAGVSGYDMLWLTLGNAMAYLVGWITGFKHGVYFSQCANCYIVITRLKDAISQDQAATSRTSMLMRILMTTIRNRNFHVVGTCQLKIVFNEPINLTW